MIVAIIMFLLLEKDGVALKQRSVSKNTFSFLDFVLEHGWLKVFTWRVFNNIEQEV